MSFKPQELIIFNFPFALNTILVGLIPRSGQSISIWLEIKCRSAFSQSKQTATAIVCIIVSVLDMLGTLWCTRSKFGWTCWQTLKERCCGFSGGRMWIQFDACDCLCRSKQETTNTEIFMISICKQCFYSELCKEGRSLWTTSYQEEALSQARPHTTTRTHGQAAFRLHWLDRPPARLWWHEALMQKQGLFEMLIMGRKGREKRGFFTAESIYIMLFCLSL